MGNEAVKLLREVYDIVCDMDKAFEAMQALADRLVGIHNRAVKGLDGEQREAVLAVTETGINRLAPYTAYYAAEKHSDGTYVLRRVGQHED